MNTQMIPDGIDPEIDVRLTAMVLGEASDFEAAQLFELMSQRPELAAWYEQLQRLHGELNQWAMLEQHLQGMSTDEQTDAAGPWTLSPEKRASVLAVLGHGNVESPVKVQHVTTWQKLSSYRPKRRSLWIASGLAASLVMLCSALLLQSVRTTHHNSRDVAMSTNLFRAATPSAAATDFVPPTSAPPGRYDGLGVGSALESSGGGRGLDYTDNFEARSSTTGPVAATPPAPNVFYSLPSPVGASGPAGGPGAGPTSAPTNNFSLNIPKDHYLQDDAQYVPNPNEPRSSLEFARQGGSAQPPTASSAPSQTSGSPSPPSSGAPSVLYAVPSQAGDMMQTVTPRIVIADEVEEMPQVTVPDDGKMMLGGVVVTPTAPAAPVISSPTSEANGRAEVDNLLGLATKAKDVDGLGISDFEENKSISATNELLREEIASKEGELSSTQESRRGSSIAGLENSERFREAEPSAEDVLDSKTVDTSRGYFGNEAKSGEKMSVAESPAPPTSLGRLDQLAENKPQGDSGMDPFGGEPPAKEPSSGGIAKQNQQAQALEKSLAENDFGTITGTAPNKPDAADRMARGSVQAFGGRGGEGLGYPKEDKSRVLSEFEKRSGEDARAKSDGENRWEVAKGKDESDWSELNSRPGESEERMRENLALGDIKKQESAEEGLALSMDADVKEMEEARTRFYRDKGRKLEDRVQPLSDLAVTGKEIKLRQQLSEKAKPSPGLNETLTEKERFSTFSLHVSDVSFKLALDSLAKGQWPEAAKIRLEEFLNAFDYQDPLPSEEEKVACQIEQAIHPFLMQRNVLRVAMRTSATGRNSATPLRLTLLLDNSGSMQRADRAQTVRRAFETLAKQLTPADQVTLISFSNEPKLRADRVSGSDIMNFVSILENSPVEGGTNLEAALQLALEKAQEAKADGAQSRVILMTDGAVNLGDADPSRLSQLVLKMRDNGIAFDAAGISAQDLNDEVLEALTRQGDGRYYLLDNAEQVDGGFAQQIAGALRPSAKNVKVQVEFNPQRVQSYKLLGFEKHVLNKEDFRNDKVDAAELAAAEAGVALYHYEVLPDGVGDVGSVSVRFQDMTTGLMVEKRWPISYEPSTARLDQANSSMKLATSAVLFAAHLKGEPLGENVDLQLIAQTLGSLDSSYSNLERVQQLRQMVESARQIAGASSGKR